MNGDHRGYGRVRINGYVLPIARPQHYEFDPTRGLTTVQEWESAGQNLDGRANQFIREGKGFSYNRNAVRSRLVMTASNAQLNFPEVATDTWQILANEASKDVRELPAVADLPEGLYSEIVNQVTTFKAGESTTDQFEPVGDYDSGSLDVASTVFDLMIKGQDHFAFSQYVVKHTTSVSNAASGNVSDNNVECIYTTGQLLGEVSSSSSWRYPMPGRLQTKISNIGVPSFKGGYVWGWRKLPSTETTGANFRIEISTEYWLDQWSTFYYGLAA